MARYLMIVSYDGTDFCGWQKQKPHAHASPLPNIQETIETALSKILNEPISISASGRTDAGVHAFNQVVHFDTDRRLPRDLCWALRSKLPDSISPKHVRRVPDEFHATLSATRKTYQYWVWNHARSTALLARYTWWLRRPLDLDYLNDLTAEIIGTHDFESFRSTGTPVRHTVRTIERAVWTRRRGAIVEFSVTGNGFMKQMVRNLVGTLVTFEEKRWNREKLKHIIELKDRRQAGLAAPARGLFLWTVEYPKSLTTFVDKSRA